jgi:hypothetical protein
MSGCDDTLFGHIESVRRVTDQYRSFIKSSCRLADLRLREQFGKVESPFQ